MKKGKKFIKQICSLSTSYNSGFIVSVIVFILLLFVSSAGIIKSCFIDEEISIINIITSCFSFLVSLCGTIKSIIILKRNCFHRKFLEEKNYKNEIIKLVSGKVNPDYADNGYAWGIYRNERFLYSEKVDQALFDRADRLLLKVSSKKKPVSNDQREALFQIVKEKVTAGKIIFNGKLVRLRTDMFVDSVLSANNDIREKDLKDLKFVEVEKTDYFSNLTTNDQIYSRLFKFDCSSIFYGKDMSVDCFNTLFNLSQSPSANIIGVSTLAITSDGYLVVNQQDNNNDVNNHNFVPSGSGSSDFADLKRCLKIEKDNSNIKNDYKLNKKYTCDFKKFITYGMVRELIEESHIGYGKKRKELNIIIKKCMQSTYICGYIRLLNRGGKPDFFGITLLDFDKNQVLDSFIKGRNNYANKRITDFNEVCEQKFIYINDFINCKNIEEIEEFLNKDFLLNGTEKNINISVQLYYLFKLLRNNKTILEKIKTNIQLQNLDKT